MIEQRSPWRWYPAGIISAMLLVFAVNGGMIYAAMHTFPGEAGQDGFDLSNSYDKVLTEAARQAALGWRVGVVADSAGRPVLRPADRSGHALPNATVQAVAERPVGPPNTTQLTLARGADGSFAAQEALGRGQWILLIDVVQDGQRFNAAERLVIR